MKTLRMKLQDTMWAVHSLPSTMDQLHRSCWEVSVFHYIASRQNLFQKYIEKRGWRGKLTQIIMVTQFGLFWLAKVTPNENCKLPNCKLTMNEPDSCASITHGSRLIVQLEVRSELWERSQEVTWADSHLWKPSDQCGSTSHSKSKIQMLWAWIFDQIPHTLAP